MITTTNTINIHIRLAQRDEISWINKKYEEVNFIPSNFENEIIAIGEFNNIKAGIGRLVKINNTAYELGGIYVFEHYRNHKIATKLIEFLLTKIDKNRDVFCIPFHILSTFYQKFGFEKAVNFEKIPHVVIEKYHWCKHAYREPVDLLFKKSKDL